MTEIEIKEKILLKILKFLDNILVKISFLRKYAFRVVFIFSYPEKKNICTDGRDEITLDRFFDVLL